MIRDSHTNHLQVVDMEELQWLPRHVRGDADAFAELIAAYRAPVWNYLARCGVGVQMRDDLFQDIFLKIHQSAPSYRATLPLRPWIFTIAANTLRNDVRDRQRSRQIFAAEELPEQPDPQPHMDDSAALVETEAWLEQAMMQLPFSQREVLVLAAIERLPLKDVAAIVNVSQNTVKTRLRRARLKLADMLAAHESLSVGPGQSHGGSHDRT